MIAQSLIPNLSDKNQSIRNECQKCFEIWIDNIGIDSLVIYIPQFLKNDNVESRIEIMKFIKRYNEHFSKNLAENTYKELVDGLLLCLQDKSNNVRSEAEDIILLSLDYIDIENYYKKIKDFKPVIEKDLKQILDNISQQKFNYEIEKEKEIEDNEELDINNDNIYNSQNINSYNSNDNNIRNESNKSNNKIKKKNKAQSPYSTFNIKEKIINSFKMKNSENIDKNNKMNLSNLILGNEDKLNYNSDYMSGDEDLELNIKEINEKNNALNSSNIKRKKNINKTAEKEKYKKPHSKLINRKNNVNTNSDNKTSGALASNSTVLRSNKNMNKINNNRKNTGNKNKIMNQIFNMNNNKISINKARRLEQDKKFKFSIDTISNDDIVKLKEFSKIIFNDDFKTSIFENNLNKEIDFFTKMTNYLDEKENLSIFFDNLDIILKIISLKINNNYNPSLLKHFFAFLESMYYVIKEIGYQLNEIEANIILCLLIDKISINNYQIKENSINLIRQYSDIIDMNKIFLCVLNFALNKNNNVKSKILDLTLEFHLNKKINMTSKSYIKTLSKYLSLNDNLIKPKCLKIFRELQDHMKEEILNSKDIGDKEKNFLKNNLIQDEENININDDNGEDYDNQEEKDEKIKSDKEIEDNYGNKSENIDDNEDEIYDNENDSENVKYDYNNEDKNNLQINNYIKNEDIDSNLNKFYLSEDRYQNFKNHKNNFDNDSENINNEEKEENFEPENMVNKIDKNINKSNNNYYVKTDNKFEDKKHKMNRKSQPIYCKNTEIISKNKKIKTIKKNNSINDNSNIKKKQSGDKLSLPKRIIVKQKKNINNPNKKLKVFSNKLNKSQDLKQKFKLSQSNKNINLKSNNINNNINNNITNNYYNNSNGNDNNSNGNTINTNDNNGSNSNYTDLSISLYNELNMNSSKNNNNNSSIFS